MYFDLQFFIKFIHILSSTVFFGTGVGIAFIMFWANLQNNIKVKLFAAKLVVLMDFIFTTPAVIAQPLTGLFLIKLAGYDYNETWLIWSYVLYLGILICWLPVLWIQIKLRNILIDAVSTNSQLPIKYKQLYRIWFALGWPAFIMVVMIFYLMVYKSLV